jgi:hypothetical protein
MDRRGGGKGRRRWRPPGGLVLLIALLLGLGAQVLSTTGGSALAWALYGVFAVTVIAAYRRSRRGDLWRAIERRTGMDREEVCALVSAALVVSTLNAAVHFADWLFLTLMLVGLTVSGLLWTHGPRNAFRPAVALPVVLRLAPVAAALAVTGLLGAAWWLLIVIAFASVAAVSLVASVWRA